MSESWYQIATLYHSIGFDIRWIVDSKGITVEEYEEITGEPFTE
ncbi:XkdX family protein [Listeria monocytogenes]|uniref:XkdX family protein n=1 Tax=Listeria monocytogenes TaxID=1639 RepID=A0A823DKW6_LISMN|nr:XkdX family protein [Listeria monocytogenes]EAD1012192.1 XkdX family protein [Listeria monocytogenes]EAD1186099.1 XkdX family protein [Listeria monocytogenes]EAF8898018.1 XkdX family protein [Listeria monocytogenes]